MVRRGSKASDATHVSHALTDAGEKPSSERKSSLESLVQETPEELSMHREFIEEEIGALRRLSGTDNDLPSVSISHFAML